MGKDSSWRKLQLHLSKIGFFLQALNIAMGVVKREDIFQYVFFFYTWSVDRIFMLRCFHIICIINLYGKTVS